MNFNRVILVGRLTNDPEERSLPSGQSVVNFGLATNRVYTDKDGNRQEQTEYHNIVLFGRTAEIAARYLGKGRTCLVEGRLQTRSWEDKKTGQKRYRTEVIGRNLQLGPRPQSDLGMSEKKPRSKPKSQPQKTSPKKEEEEEVDVEDIPF